MIRFFDILFSFIGLIIFSPLIILIALIIKMNSKGPILFNQSRVGKGGNEFKIHKFRTMRTSNSQLSLITIGNNDIRITSIGYYLRLLKLDELPQLLNVFFGEMSLVGPRPEVKHYVNYYTESQKIVLSLRPGITDWASIKFRNENELLKKSNNPEQEYINNIIPEKIKYNLIFIQNQTVLEYFKILINTFLSIIYLKI